MSDPITDAADDIIRGAGELIGELFSGSSHSSDSCSLCRDEQDEPEEEQPSASSYDDSDSDSCSDDERSSDEPSRSYGPAVSHVTTAETQAANSASAAAPVQQATTPPSSPQPSEEDEGSIIGGLITLFLGGIIVAGLIGALSDRKK